MKSWIVKTHWLIKLIFKNQIWKIPAQNKTLYLTFDDGPIPEVTPWVLEVLKHYNVKATFFCIGDNVRKYPEILEHVISQGHSIGNHTFNHLKGWKHSKKEYTNNVLACSNVLPTNTSLFRPPYGKITPTQSKYLRRLGYKIIMWDVLSMDYDTTTTKTVCLANVIDNVEDGSIIVFHDSIKAFKNLKYVLPKSLEILKKRGYKFKTL